MLLSKESQICASFLEFILNMAEKNYEVGYCKPPNRFSSTNQPLKHGRHQGRTPSDWLRILNKTKIDFQNPFTGKVEKGNPDLIAAIELILQVTQDKSLKAIKEYFDRREGKAIQKLIGEGFTNPEGKIIIIYANKPAEVNSNTESRIPTA